VLNLLDRARMLLQGLATPASTQIQYFNVLCPEGHRLRGERAEGYQVLRCPTCGEGIFILPRSPLPDPVAPSAPTRPRRPADTEWAVVEEDPFVLTDPLPVQEAKEPEGDGEITWIDGDAETSPSAAPPVEPPVSEQLPMRRPAAASRPKGAAAAPQRVRSPVSKPAPRRVATASVATETAPAAAVRVRLADWVRHRRNPLIFLGVALIVAGTIGIRAWRSWRQELPQIAKIAATQGLPALDEGRFDTAHQLLSAGKRAVDALDGAVEDAEEIRHGADEAAIFASLVPESLEAILAEAGAYQDPAEWPSRFATLYKGRSVILDAHVTAVPDADSQGRYELDYCILQNGGDGSRPPRVGRIDLTGFRLFELTKPKEGDQVTFGARLASFTFDIERGEWLVGLVPDSGVSITHRRALKSLGWPSEGFVSTEDQP
jgi:hypothetical protein